MPCNVATVAKSVHHIVTTEFPHLSQSVCLYTQDTNVGKKFKDIRNIQEAWRKYKVLIYSPTIMAGVSFEMEHFDVLFGYF